MLGTSQPTKTTLSGYHAALVEHERWKQQDSDVKIFPKPSAHACTLATKLGAFGDVKRGASERKTIQPAWSAFLKRIGSIQKQLAVEIFDRHKEPTIGTNIPDLVGYFKVQVLSPLYFFCLLGQIATCEIFYFCVKTRSGILSMRVQHVFSG